MGFIADKAPPGPMICPTMCPFLVRFRRVLGFIADKAPPGPTICPFLVGRFHGELDFLPEDFVLMFRGLVPEDFVPVVF